MAEEDRSRLIARELLRKKAKTVVVAAPPSVPEQWKAELEERFGLVFEILDRTYLTRMRRERGFGVNPWRTHRDDPFDPFNTRASLAHSRSAVRSPVRTTACGVSYDFTSTQEGI